MFTEKCFCCSHRKQQNPKKNSKFFIIFYLQLSRPMRWLQAITHWNLIYYFVVLHNFAWKRNNRQKNQFHLSRVRYQSNDTHSSEHNKTNNLFRRVINCIIIFNNNMSVFEYLHFTLIALWLVVVVSSVCVCALLRTIVVHYNETRNKPGSSAPNRVNGSQTWEDMSE